MKIPQLKQNLAISFHETIAWIKAQEAEKFEQGPKDKWDTSQHLDHLMGSAKRIDTALRMPKSMIIASFGKSDRRSRDYDTIVAHYQEKLKHIPSSIVPSGEKHPIAEKIKLLEQFEVQGEEVSKAIDEWTEVDLDSHLLPHPLLGKMTIRELLLWMTYHNYHHLNNLKANY